MTALTSEDIFQTCSIGGGGSTISDTSTVMTQLTIQQESLSCLTQQLLEQDRRDREYARVVLVLLCAGLIFFMQSGFAMLCAGAVRRKNVQNTLLKNLLDACGASLAFYVVGYAFAFGDGENPNRFIGTTNFCLIGVDDYAYWMFQYAFSAASATIVAGTLAERCQMAAYLCYSCLLAGFVYPVVAHSIWSQKGFLSPHIDQPLFGIGVVDFAGGGVVHTTGGTTALFATMILGPRRGRFHDEQGRRLDKPKDFPGHSMALQMLGTFTLWFGWFGFNGGSALIIHSPDMEKIAALAIVNTTLAGGMGGMCALFVNFFILERCTGEPIFDLKMAMNGCLGGLVSITAGAGVVEPWAAVLIGSIAGLLYLRGTRLLVKLRLDDAVDAIPVHMFNGMWGVVAVGLFASKRFLKMNYGADVDHVGFVMSWGSTEGVDGRLLAANVVGIIWIFVWILGIMFPFFVWLDWMGWFRSDPLEEIVGLDTSYHGGLILTTGEEKVNPEYISQFRKQREEMRSRRTSRESRIIAFEENNFGDDEPDREAEDQEYD